MLHVFIVTFTSLLSFTLAILNGNPINLDEKQYGHHVSIKSKEGEFLCSGALITYQHVLTSAKCVHSIDSNNKW